MTIFTTAYTNDSQANGVSGLFIQFKDEITENKVKDILSNYNLNTYKLNYNVYGMENRYYIMVDKDKILNVRGEFGKDENWTESTPAIEKGDSYIIMVSSKAINNKDFIQILNKYNLQVKTSIWCHITFTDRPWNGISEEYANELKYKLEKNENVLSVTFESIKS
jgi:hypothetical protein